MRIEYIVGQTAATAVSLFGRGLCCAIDPDSRKAILPPKHLRERLLDWLEVKLKPYILRENETSFNVLELETMRRRGTELEMLVENDEAGNVGCFGDIISREPGTTMRYAISGLSRIMYASTGLDVNYGLNEKGNVFLFHINNVSYSFLGPPRLRVSAQRRDPKTNLLSGPEYDLILQMSTKPIKKTFYTYKA